MRRLSLAVFLAALGLHSPVLAQPAAAGAAAALDAALAGLVALPEAPPGAIAIVQRGDRLTVHTAGVADIATGRAIEPTDHMRTASVAKAYNGAVALALIDRGQLSLDDTIGELLGGTPGTWSPITVRQLLKARGVRGARAEREDPSAEPRARLPLSDRP